MLNHEETSQVSMQLKPIIEAAIFAANGPMKIEQLQQIFGEECQPSLDEVKAVIAELHQDYQDRGIELREVANGLRFQVRATYSEWVGRIFEEKPPRYSRAFLETLALIAYRQPVTRAEIEDIRGVSLSSYLLKTLMEREWIKIVGHRDVPGKPALYATTREFLDYFNLTTLSDLPPLIEVSNMEQLSLPEEGLSLLAAAIDSDVDSVSDEELLHAEEQIEEAEIEMAAEEEINEPDTEMMSQEDVIDAVQ
jgi:segregation and condensation protein B